MSPRLPHPPPTTTNLAQPSRHNTAAILSSVLSSQPPSPEFSPSPRPRPLAPIRHTSQPIDILKTAHTAATGFVQTGSILICDSRPFRLYLTQFPPTLEALEPQAYDQRCASPTSQEPWTPNAGPELSSKPHPRRQTSPENLPETNNQRTRRPPHDLTPSPTMSTQRPFFLSTFFAAFRHQAPPSLSTAAQQPNKHTTQPGAGPSTSYTSSAPRTIATSSQTSSTSPSASRSGVIGQLPLHSPRSHHHHGPMPIPQQQTRGSGRRRGSDSSSEGFRDVLGVDKLYIGGRTATGEEKFFKLGVVRRVRSGDRLSLDRLSL
ncbi:hypothetical protein QBC39DRAFT_337540 [Podospora conica]|nr:hypothetical protein QBC39DRAFT_337540 [Schizothecium conicum]